MTAGTSVEGEGAGATQWASAVAESVLTSAENIVRHRFTWDGVEGTCSECEWWVHHGPTFDKAWTAAQLHRRVQIKLFLAEVLTEVWRLADA